MPTLKRLAAAVFAAGAATVTLAVPASAVPAYGSFGSMVRVVDMDARGPGSAELVSYFCNVPTSVTPVVTQGSTLATLKASVPLVCDGRWHDVTFRLSPPSPAYPALQPGLATSKLTINQGGRSTVVQQQVSVIR